MGPDVAHMMHIWDPFFGLFQKLVYFRMSENIDLFSKGLYSLTPLMILRNMIVSLTYFNST